MVADLGELGGLVGVEDHDPHRGLVLKGAFLQIAGIHQGVGHFHRERVRVAGLVIQQLWDRRTGTASLSTNQRHGHSDVVPPLQEARAPVDTSRSLVVL